ncbi:MAG TPA: hypothetical protein VLE53_11615 [Gemmatimonadaceae bacterium]|nr:hypothetical protein [Gemmatimonadaceae bacterium]
MSPRPWYPPSDPSRRRLARLLLPTALVTSALGACVEEPTIPALRDQAIELTVTPSSFVLRTGEIDTITVTITNRLAEQVRLVFPTTCPVRLAIRDADARLRVPEGGVYDCPAIQSQLLIPPGGAITEEFYWTGGTQFDALPPSPRLPAGRYYASARLEAAGYSTVGFAVLITLVD